MARGKKKKTSSGLPLLINIAAFDTRHPLVRDIAKNQPLADVASITHDQYRPMGGTPLNDAVLKFGERLDDQFKSNPEALHVGLLADESGSMAHLQNDVIEGFNTFIDELRADENPTTEPGVIMVIMTDGHENSSHEDPTGENVRAWTKQREAEGWNFFYLGANQDAWQAGRDLGLGVNSASFDYAATSGGTRTAMRNVSSATNLRKTTDSNVYASALASTTPDVKLWTPEDEDDSEE